MMEFVPIEFDEATLDEYSALFGACFPDAERFSRAYLKWLYCDNPDGRAVGFDARQDGVLAAHYVCIPAEFLVEGKAQRMLLSLNTATAPAFQGQGLFTKLASLTYEAAAADGYAGVYGVANANSTPGFVRKLGFQLVRPLEAMIGIGGLRLRTAPAPAVVAFERRWSSSSLAWRCNGPYHAVHAHARAGRWQCQAPAFGAWMHAYAELPAAALTATGVAGLPGAPLSPLRLYLGLVPDAVRGLASYVSIPQRLRPSPLNLIYRAFTPAVPRLDPSRIHFSFLDFDAY